MVSSVFPPCKNMTSAIEAEVRTQISSGKLQKSKDKNRAVCNFEVQAGSEKNNKKSYVSLPALGQ